MKDFLGTSRWINRPLHNPTQNEFTRFVKQPQSGLRDYLSGSRTKLDKIWKDSMKTEFTRLMEGPK